MKKETITALVLGIGTGAVIAVGLLINARKINVSQTKPTPSVGATSVTLPIQSQPFVVRQPEDKKTVNDDELLITGEAPVKSTIVVQSQFSEQTIIAEKTTFEMNFALQYGENIIKVTNYDGKNISEKKLTVYYLPED